MMERLTKKNDDMGCYTQFGDKYIPNHNIRHKQCVEKLGKLEDIEQELGITLEVLFKALKDGIYYDDGDNIDFSYTSLFNDEDDCEWYFTTDSATFVELKDYGTWWWLEEPKEK